MLKTRRLSFHYVLFYKPYGVLSQFTAQKGRKTPADFGPFPHDVYPVGRLDADSEGLLLLTNDNLVAHRLTDPTFGHPRTYLVQVERIPNTESLEKLRKGIMIEGRKTKPAAVRLLESDPDLPARPVPIRLRKTVPTVWLEVTLHEGRNRQIRKMTAAVGHPTLRLVRTRIGDVLTLEGLFPGESRSITESEIHQLRRKLGIERRLSSH